MSRIEASVLDQHAIEAALLWATRDVVVIDPAYDLAALTELDERIEANLDGLRVGGDDGYRAGMAALADPEGGEIFAATVLAVERRDLPAIARILDVAGDCKALSRGLVSGFGWAAFEHVRAILPGLLDGRCPPALHTLGISACSVHRQDPGRALEYALSAGEPRLRARAYRAVGELGRADLARELRGALGDEDPGCRFWAAWSGTVLGDGEATRSLWSVAAAGGRHAARAGATVARRVDPATAASWIKELAAGAPRVALASAAALGDPALVPWIIEAMKVPAIARAAGAAFTLITGADLIGEKLRGKAPEGFAAGPSDDPDDADVALDPDEPYPWPSAEAVAAWWGRRGRGLARGSGHLLGRAKTPEGLQQILQGAPQPARAAAAEELSIRHPRRPLFEVRAPGFVQQRAFAAA